MSPRDLDIPLQRTPSASPPHSPLTRSRFPSRLCRAFLLVYALRLFAWVFLLPPWSGPDEPAHVSYAVSNASRLRWPAFGALEISPAVLAALQHDSVPEHRSLSGPIVNYETQQSPLYYWLSGLFLRCLPGASPIQTLYSLRIMNALLALGAGVVTAVAAARLLGARDWLAMAYLALLPGLGFALTRVSNDALAAFLVSFGVASTLGIFSRRAELAGAIASGLAPWAKLYGAAAVPGAIVSARRGRDRAWRFILSSGLSIALLFLSWVVTGHAFPLMENIVNHGEVGLGDVPWLKNVWSIGKTHLFVAGVSAVVFPKVVYVFALSLLGVAVVYSLGVLRRQNPGMFMSLSLPLAIFGASLLYHSWRNYSYTRGSGGTGGWYLWAMLLPESLLVVWGFVARPLPAAWRTGVLVFFGLMTIAGDVVLFGLPSEMLLLSGREAVGVRFGAISEAWSSFVASRPGICAYLAAGLVLISWVSGVWTVVWSGREDQPNPAGHAALSIDKSS